MRRSTDASTLGEWGRSAGVAVGLAGLVTYLVPAWLVHDRVTRVVGSRRDGGSREIARVSVSSTPLDSVMRSGRPMIVEGLIDRVGLADLASPDGLVARDGAAPVDVAFHDADAPYFLYSGGYGAQVRERRTMSVADFIDLMFDQGIGHEHVVYQLFGPRSLGGTIGDILREFEAALTPLAGRRGEPRFSGVWIGSTGVVTPLHHDAWPGLLLQIHGTKRVTMFGPTDRCNLYFSSPYRGKGRWSDLPARSAEASVEQYPRTRHATSRNAVLRPGDALFIPPFWAHEMEALEPNVSVPFRFATSPRSYLDPGFLRPAAEMLRGRARRAAGSG